MLVNERFESASIRDLLERTLAPFGISEAQLFRLSGPEVRLPPKIAVALALGLHELATKAAKYGALSRAGGTIDLTWKVVDGRRPHRLHFSWVETGGPQVAPPSGTGFGTRLIERVMAREINGIATIEYRPEGVVFTAVAPLPEPSDETDE